MTSQSEKVLLLQHAASMFQKRLALEAPNDPEVAAVLRGLHPLLAKIAQGLIFPPAEELYERQFHIEHPRHGLGTPLFEEQANFLSALLDWRSKPWFPK